MNYKSNLHFSCGAGGYQRLFEEDSSRFGWRQNLPPKSSIGGSYQSTDGLFLSEIAGILLPFIAIA
jgi:hypothetical protein